jgi:hypothetical protein
MASGWQGVADQMNAMFQNDGSITDTGKRFRKKHGDDGKGTDGHGHPAGKPYKFGFFAVDVADKNGKRAVSADKEAAWLIDTGTRHFDATSIALIENAIIDSLTKNGNEIPISFIIDTLNPPPAGKPAYARVASTTDSQGKINSYSITIHCIP